MFLEKKNTCDCNHTSFLVDFVPTLHIFFKSTFLFHCQENRRLSSGKKMHPFFASRKMSKGASQDQDVVNIEDVHGLCDFDRDPPFYPIHVVYQLEVCQAYA